MKKFFVLILATLMATTCAFSIIGCAGTDTGEQKVMNLSLNPKVEFVLDEDDKVVSVNALNEEGNLVISAEVFTGKTAEEAANLFVEVSLDTGFLVSGNASADENELQISFSGDTKEAEDLYNDVKTKVNEYLTAENVTITIKQASSITEEQLQALVAECAPYLDKAKIQAMEYSELVDQIAQSRAETQEFYSQELKNAYYEAKAFAMEQAEIQAVKVQAGISGIAGIALDSAYNIYAQAVENIESARMTMLVNEDSPYQVALQAFRQAKTEYLNYRNYVATLEEHEVTTTISQQLANFQATVDNAETALLQAGETANNTLDTIKAQIKTAYDSVVGLIEGYSAKVSQYASQITTKQQEAQTAFFADFEASYAQAITDAKANWEEMKADLEQGETAQ